MTLLGKGQKPVRRLTVLALSRWLTTSNKSWCSFRISGPVSRAYSRTASCCLKRLFGYFWTRCWKWFESPHNLLANKAELAHYAGRFSEFLPSGDADLLVRALSPLAEGQVSDVTSDASGSADDALNPFKINAGAPAQVQGTALVALARLDKYQPGVRTTIIQDLIAAGLAHTNASVRRNSYIAASWLSDTSDAIVTGLLVGCARRQCRGRRGGTGGSRLVRTCFARQPSDGLSDSSRSSRIGEQRRYSSFSIGQSDASAAQEKPHRLSHACAWRDLKASGGRSSVLGAINACATLKWIAWYACTDFVWFLSGEPTSPPILSRT